MTSSLRTRLVALAVVLLIFGSGVAVGMAVDGRMAVAAPDGEAVGVAVEEGAEDPDPEDEDERSGWIIEQVDLTEDQRAQVDSLLDHFRERVKNFERSFRKDYQGIVSETRAALKEVLDEEQRVRYEALLQERDRRKRR